MELGLKDKKALVLASSQGLGNAVATSLVQEGAHVVIVGRDAEKLEKVAAEMNDKGAGKAEFVVADLSNKDAAADLYKQAKEKLGKVDILVNNTGGPPPGTTEAPDADAWRHQFDTMILRVIEITNLCLPDMKAQKWGRVLTIASSGVEQPIPNLAMSNTLRSSLVGWSKTLANEVGQFGITSNMQLPGRILTARLDQLDNAAAERTGRSVDEVRAANVALIPVGRYGRIEEFGDLAAFLVSERASYVNGSVVRCDGGATKGI
jgi:3-oxoacyl-[acyl-carrier protein] reductase